MWGCSASPNTTGSRDFLSCPTAFHHMTPLAHDTFGRVFSRIDPAQFQICFVDWVKGISELTQGEVIAIDGKTLRRSHDSSRGKAAIHMVRS